MMTILDRKNGRGEGKHGDFIQSLYTTTGKTTAEVAVAVAVAAAAAVYQQKSSISIKDGTTAA